MNTEYRVVITNETSENSKSPIAPTENGGETGVNNSGNNKSGKKGEKAFAYVFYKRAVAPFVKQVVQHSIGTVALKTGNHELQARLQTAYDVGSQVVSFAENIITGAIVGNAWGAIAGALLSVAQSGVSISQKYDIFNTQKLQENTSLALMDVRAGGNVATTSGRRR